MKSVILALLLCLLLSPLLALAIQPENGDVDCSGTINILDIVGLVNYKFKGGEAPCEFVGPGVTYTHYDSRSIDIGTSFEPLVVVSLYAPEAGFANVNYSFYTMTNTCLELDLESGTPRDQSIVNVLTTDSPVSWAQTFYVPAGLTEFTLGVRGCLRDKEEEKAVVNFYNVNMNVTFIPEYYGPREAPEED